MIVTFKAFSRAHSKCGAKYKSQDFLNTTVFAAEAGNTKCGLITLIEKVNIELTAIFCCQKF